MNDELKFAGVGVYLYGALYLAGVFVAGITSNETTAVVLAIIAAGLSYVAQTMAALRVTGMVSALNSFIASVIAVAVSVAAGVSLLV